MPNLAQAHAMPKHPDPQFHSDADYQASVERSKVAQQQARAEVAAGDPALTRYFTDFDAKQGELRRLLTVAQPLLTKTPLRQRHNCQMKVDEAIEQFGLTTVVQCLALVLAANGIDITTKTINELAMGEEKQ